MMSLRDKAFGNAAEAQRMTELGLYALAQYHWRTAVRQFRQWERGTGRGSTTPTGRQPARRRLADQAGDGGALLMPTLKQDQMYARLRLSSEFSADEVAVWDSTLKGYLTTIELASDLLDTMLDRIDARDKRKHDAAQRKAEYYAKKGA